MRETALDLAAETRSNLNASAVADSARKGRWSDPPSSGLRLNGSLTLEVGASSGSITSAPPSAAMLRASMTPHSRSPLRPELLTVKGVSELLQFSESWVWDRVARGVLPQPVKIGGATRWYRHEVEAWIEEQSAQRQSISPSRPRKVADGSDGKPLH